MNQANQTKLLVEEKESHSPLGSSEHKQRYYVYLPKGSEHRRIIGGLGWPIGNAPGFIVVVAEDLHKDKTLKQRHYRIFEEYENRDVDLLLQRLSELKKVYFANPWYADVESTKMEYLEKFNRGKSYKKQFGLDAAPLIDDPKNLDIYANMIRSKLAPGRATMHFGDQSRLPGYLMQLQPKDVATKKVQMFPPVAAIAFAIAGLDIWEEGAFESFSHMQDTHFAQYEVEGL